MQDFDTLKPVEERARFLTAALTVDIGDRWRAAVRPVVDSLLQSIQSAGPSPAWRRLLAALVEAGEIMSSGGLPTRRIAQWSLVERAVVVGAADTSLDGMPRVAAIGHGSRLLAIRRPAGPWSVSEELAPHSLSEMQALALKVLAPVWAHLLGAPDVTLAVLAASQGAVELARPWLATTSPEHRALWEWAKARATGSSSALASASKGLEGFPQAPVARDLAALDSFWSVAVAQLAASVGEACRSHSLATASARLRPGLESLISLLTRPEAAAHARPWAVRFWSGDAPGVLAGAALLAAGNQDLEVRTLDLIGLTGALLPDIEAAWPAQLTTIVGRLIAGGLDASRILRRVSPEGSLPTVLRAPSDTATMLGGALTRVVPGMPARLLREGLAPNPPTEFPNLRQSSLADWACTVAMLRTVPLPTPGPWATSVMDAARVDLLADWAAETQAAMPYPLRSSMALELAATGIRQAGWSPTPGLISSTLAAISTGFPTTQLGRWLWLWTSSVVAGAGTEVAADAPSRLGLWLRLTAQLLDSVGRGSPDWSVGVVLDLLTQAVGQIQCLSPEEWSRLVWDGRQLQDLFAVFRGEGFQVYLPRVATPPFVSPAMLEARMMAGLVDAIAGYGLDPPPGAPWLPVATLLLGLGKSGPGVSWTPVLGAIDPVTGGSLILAPLVAQSAEIIKAPEYPGLLGLVPALVTATNATDRVGLIEALIGDALRQGGTVGRTALVSGLVPLVRAGSQDLPPSLRASLVWAVVGLWREHRGSRAARRWLPDAPAVLEKLLTGVPLAGLFPVYAASSLVDLLSVAVPALNPGSGLGRPLETAMKPLWSALWANQANQSWILGPLTDPDSASLWDPPLESLWASAISSSTRWALMAWVEFGQGLSGAGTAAGLTRTLLRLHNELLNSGALVPVPDQWSAQAQLDYRASVLSPEAAESVAPLLAPDSDQGLSLPPRLLAAMVAAEADDAVPTFADTFCKPKGGAGELGLGSMLLDLGPAASRVFCVPDLLRLAWAAAARRGSVKELWALMRPAFCPRAATAGAICTALTSSEAVHTEWLALLAEGPSVDQAAFVVELLDGSDIEAWKPLVLAGPASASLVLALFDGLARSLGETGAGASLIAKALGQILAVPQAVNDLLCEDLFLGDPRVSGSGLPVFEGIVMTVSRAAEPIKAAVQPVLRQLLDQDQVRAWIAATSNESPENHIPVIQDAEDAWRRGLGLSPESPTPAAVLQLIQVAWEAELTSPHAT